MCELIKNDLRIMSKEVEQLAHSVRRLLLNSGFPEEQFYIKVEGEKIKVLFDTEEAVEYFRSDFDYSYLAESHLFRYQIDGKRHCAIIY
jgi:hypothetical protein